MKRKICVVTGSRADYGLLQPIITALREAQDIELEVCATWDCPAFNYRFLSEDTDTFNGVCRSISFFIENFAKTFTNVLPDLLVLLGDRYEIFAAATAALIARIPIAHIHGGETTEGAFDEALRHSITKMSHLHFVAAEEYRRRVIQLGEHPGGVFLVGGLGVDNILNTPLKTRKELEADIGFDLGQKALLVVFHPVTLGNSSERDMRELLTALDALKDTRLIFNAPNTDTGNLTIGRLIDEFAAEHTNAVVFGNSWHSFFLSLLHHVDGIIGNSSSGLLEAPSLHAGTINIGDRQKGRLKASSVIDCDPTQESILAAIDKLYSPAFREALKTVVNPYGEGGATVKIVKVLCEHPLDGLLKKKFYDL